MNSKSIAAFFDFDETLLDVESSRLGFRYLWQQRLVSFRFILKVLVANFIYRHHWISDEKMARILIKFYRNRNIKEFENGAADFYRDHLKPHLAPNLVARVKKHRQEGHRLILISGSVRYMLEPVVEDLGFDHLLCTDLEIGENGLLTGRAAGPVCLSRTKRHQAEKLACRENLDLASSYAYGNHQSDLPLLELIGNPYVVEPTAPLRNKAVIRKWPILTYR
ncbi:MAG: HAD family hydrolase [Desulfobacterales bacterium]